MLLNIVHTQKKIILYVLNLNHIKVVGGYICARKQADYYSKRCKYLESKLDIQEDNLLSEIEKMYKNAGIEVPIARLKILENDNGEIYTQPPFTAEKQLNIVKFLLNKSVYYDTYGDREYWFHLSDEIKNSKYREFNEAIAECINKMWENLRDYEKVQIKEILE